MVVSIADHRSAWRRSQEISDSGRPVLGFVRSGCGLDCEGDGGKQATVHRGDHEVSRKPLHREGRSVSACTCGSRALAQFLLRGSPGCSGHPAFPVPSAFPEGRDSRHNSGETRRENAAPCFFACDSGSLRFARNDGVDGPRTASMCQTGGVESTRQGSRP